MRFPGALQLHPMALISSLSLSFGATGPEAHQHGRQGHKGEDHGVGGHATNLWGSRKNFLLSLPWTLDLKGVQSMS